MPRAIRIHEYGGPEVLRWEEIEEPTPGPGEVRLRQTAIGLNYIDTYQRSGLYPVSLPATLGSEGAGTIDRLGPGVTQFKTGDRVAYAHAPGAYAEMRVIAADRLVALPNGITDQMAAAMMLKGLTAHYLCRRTYRVTNDDTVLFHAAAGGVGLIFGQWVKSLGATAIGTVGSPQKAEIAKTHGYDHVIPYKNPPFPEAIRTITKGALLPVVYDGIGKDTFMDSLDCLKPRGLMVSFGNASGTVPAFNPLILSQKGSLYLTRPNLATYIAKREDFEQATSELFDAVMKGILGIKSHKTYPLAEAQAAHRELEARRTMGSVVLMP